MALIPARGGSKRLPGKNIRLFGGKPLIATSIAQALESRRVDRVLVSTEDHAIAKAARSFGADVLDRPTELATDESSTGAVLEHAVCSLSANAELVVTLQPTNPLRPSRIIDRAIELFEQTLPDSVVSVSSSPSKRGRVVDGWFEPDYATGTRSQDLPKSFGENGLVYVTSRAVAAQGDVFGSRIVALPVDEVYALGDIDTLEDFERTEHLFTCFRNQLAPKEAESA